MPDIALSIVHFGSVSITEEAVRSLHQDPDFPRMRIVLVAPPDDPLSTWLEQTCTIVRAPNRGYAAAHNSALRWLRAQPASEAPEAIAFLNNDLSIPPGVVTDLVAALLADPANGAIAPQQVDTNGAIFPSAFHLKTRQYEKYGLVACQFVDAVGCVDILHGPFIMVKWGAMSQIGYWNESYFHYYDDDDLSLRLHRAGYHLLTSPQRVLHHFGASLSASSPLSQYYITRNRLHFIHDHFGSVLLDRSLRNVLREAVAIRTRLSGTKPGLPLGATLGFGDFLRGRRGPVSTTALERLSRLRH